MGRPAIGFVAALMLMASGAVARADVQVDDDSSEAQLMGFYAAALSFTPAGVPPGRVFEAGFEATYLPSLSEGDRETNFAGAKVQATNFTQVLGRPRLRYRPPGGWLLEAAFFPEVEVFGVTPASWALSAAYQAAGRGGPVGFWVRAHYLQADIEGPITCDEDAIEDPTNAVCFGGQESNDHFRPTAYGLDLILEGPRFFADTLAWYAAAGYRHETLRFETDFVNLFGRLDDQNLVARLDRGSVMGGLTWTPVAGLRLTFEGSYAPEALATCRVAIGYGWGAR